jgi:hypothetical protein
MKLRLHAALRMKRISLRVIAPSISLRDYLSVSGAGDARIAAGSARQSQLQDERRTYFSGSSCGTGLAGMKVGCALA